LGVVVGAGLVVVPRNRFLVVVPGPVDPSGGAVVDGLA
jgi:hypothetical protein